MVTAETVISGFVIAVMLAMMGVMVYFAFATQDDEGSGPDDPATEAADAAE
ncbi:MAG: hypothetical protein ABEI80_03130 [Haloplanus sp.]